MQETWRGELYEAYQLHLAMQPASSRVRAMCLCRHRLTVIAALLLTAIAFAGEFVETDHHHAVGLAPTDLPIFEGVGEDDQPDPTLHVEAATQIEPETCFGCVGCLPHQRQLAVESSAPTPEQLGPDTSAVVVASAWGLGTDARRLKPSRAPPKA